MGECLAFRLFVGKDKIKKKESGNNFQRAAVSFLNAVGA